MDTTLTATTTSTFNDIFKSSFLDKTESFSIIDSLIGLLLAFTIGLFIYVIYKKTFSGVMYSHNFNISLIIMTMATALIIMGISTNIVISLGMVGALSIVRFRTPIKDPMDLVFLFWYCFWNFVRGWSNSTRHHRCYFNRYCHACICKPFDCRKSLFIYREIHRCFNRKNVRRKDF